MKSRHFAVAVAVAIDIDAPPDRVWSIMRDIERWHEWTPSVTRIERVGSGPLAVGSGARIRQPKLPPGLWRVTDLDDSRRTFTWVNTGPGVRVEATHRVDAAPAGSRAMLAVHFSGLLGPFVGWLTRGINTRYLALEAKGLKTRSEAPETNSST